MNVFETETMAELCVKQGHVAEALAIYRRLLANAGDDATRARRAARVAELQTLTPGEGLASREPALRAARRGDTLTLEWTLPPDTESPALQLLLLRRGADGVETETRTLPLPATRGSASLDAAGVDSVRAAVGRLDGARFVPIARLPPGQP
jgi:hypothetical protein